MAGKQRPARPLERAQQLIVRLQRGALHHRRQTGRCSPYQFGKMFGRQIGPHRLILAPHRLPLPLGQRQRDDRVTNFGIVRRQDRFGLGLFRLLAIGAPDLPQQQADPRTHLHMGKQGRPQQGRLRTDGRPA